MLSDMNAPIHDGAQRPVSARTLKRRAELGITGLGGIAQCLDCGGDFVKTALPKVRCTPCQEAMRKARAAERLRKNRKRYGEASLTKRAERLGSQRLNEPVSCKDCGASFVRGSGFAKYCKGCRERGKWSRLPEEKKAAVRERRREQRRKRASSDPSYLLNKRMSEGVKRALKLGKLGKSWREMVSFSLEELRSHIERQFLAGMTWENMGEWHIDHRVPLALFKFETPDDPEFKAAWALTNLQPLWGRENVKKSNKRLLLV